MNLQSTISELKSIKNNINKQFGVVDDTLWQNNVLHLDAPLCSGQISVVPISENIYFLDFDIVCSRDYSFAMFGGNFRVINFLYCLEGDIQQGFLNEKSTNTISQYNSAIVKTQAKEGLVLNFKKDKRIKFSNISVFEEDNLLVENDYLEKVFSIFTENNKVHINPYHIKLAEQLDDFHKIKGEGLIPKLQKDAVVMMLLAEMIKDFQFKKEHALPAATQLSIREIGLIRELAENITQFPEKEYSINKLMLETGLSAAKLQEGFKLISNFTVTEFIRNARLDKAEELIRTTDLTISEVVYTIGFSSRSYFSKIFKQKYNCSPKYYQENAGLQLVASA